MINRYSLDGLPRSLSIRQGMNLWLGYDLQRATLRKVWQAPEGKSGLISLGFITNSQGTSWFEDKSGETWQLLRNGNAVPLEARYLGCSQGEGMVELQWELRHSEGVCTLRERVPTAAASAKDRVTRFLRVENLAAGDVLLPPLPVLDRWKIADGKGEPAFSKLIPLEWNVLTLP